jgi:hypothetical protein
MKKTLVALVIAACMSLLAESAVAYSCYNVPGHWNHGRWIPAHRVCGGGYGYGTRCHMVGGYWRHGYWHPARRVCWRY